MIEICETEKGLKILVDRIMEEASQKNGMYTVFLAGGSASGKSTGTKKVEEQLKLNGIDALAMTADDYYKGGRIIMELLRTRNIGFDDPEAIFTEWIREDIGLFNKGLPVKEKKYSFGDDPAKETGKILFPPKVLLLEGLFVLREELRDLADLKVFFDIGLHGWLLRRILRDTERTGQKPADILHYCATVVAVKYQEWILSTKQYADIVIRNEYQPEIEAKNTKRNELQIKFSSEISKEKLLHLLCKAGADDLGQMRQKDIYYNPHDRNLAMTNESMRIREESGGRIIWTYKGPVDNNAKFRVRPKYEFEISSAVRNEFLNIYGNAIKTIEKTRIMFLLESVVVSVDRVTKTVGNADEDLGIFVEFRINSKNIEEGEKKIQKIAGKLGFKMEEAIKESYIEL